MSGVMKDPLDPFPGPAPAGYQPELPPTDKRAALVGVQRDAKWDSWREWANRVGYHHSARQRREARKARLGK